MDAKEALLAKKVVGALRSAIEEHGPITYVWVGSAAKRIVGEILKNGGKHNGRR
jgi:hypothetical protein